MEYMEAMMQNQYDAQNQLIMELDQVRAERDALAAQVEDLEFQRVCAVTQATNMFDALRLAIAAFDKYEMSVDDYPSIEHVRMRERLYSAAFLNADRHLAEIRAEAIVSVAKDCYEISLIDKFVFELLNKIAAKVRQGGE